MSPLLLLLAAATPSLAGVVKAEKAAKLTPDAKAALARDGSVCVEGKEPHFFSLYDRNAYEGLPSFVTLDVVLHLFHLRFDARLARLEQDVAAPSLAAFAAGQSKRALALGAPPLLAAYHLVPRVLLEGDEAAAGAPPAVAELVAAEVKNIRAESGASTRVCPRSLDYTRFHPRGHYASYGLRAYFQAATFYAECAFDLETPEGTARALDVARLVTPEDRAAIDRVRDIAAFVAGAPDDPGLPELARLAEGAPPLPAPLPKAALDKALAAARSLPPPQVIAQAAPAEPPRRVFRLLGGAGTPDSALLGRTARPFPSALDVLAALGVPAASKELKPAPDLAAILAEPFPPPRSAYDRWLRLLALAAAAPEAEEHPPFEKTERWARRLLVTGAGSWAELRHDTLLYVKPPIVWMEGGHDAELPAQKAGGYVEPRPEVYRAMGELHADVAARFGAAPSDALGELLEFLRATAELELAATPFPRATDERLRTIGKELERLTRGGADALNPQPLIADVFTSVTPDGVARTFHAGVGFSDELWVIVPRGKQRLLTRGAVFSYHEHAAAPGVRLDDAAWEEMLRAGKAPPRPEWARPLPAAKLRRR